MASQSDTESVRSEQSSIFLAPGTEILFDQGGDNSETHQWLQRYQHLRQGDSHILLVPQPSLTDPNDPLRWSNVKKWATFGNGLAYSFLGAVTGPIMAAWMIQGSELYGVSLQRMTYANGANLLCQGVATTIWMPFATKYGRRPVYLLSTLLLGLACVWLGIASTTTYTSWITGRAFLGVWEAPIESIVPSTITDIFFLHDRGTKVSWYGLSVLGGNELGPMLSAFIIQNLGMDWAFYIVAMFVALNLVTMVLFMPETKYTGERPVIYLKRPNNLSDETLQGSGSSTPFEKEPTDDHEKQPIETVKARSWAQEIIRLPKNDPDVNLLHAFLRPFVLVAYPTVIWSCFIYGLSLSWNVIMGATTAQLFAPAPYNFSASAQGLVFVSPLVGSLVGSFLCGPMADWVANYLTKRNNGVREPEMRLPVCAVAALLTFFGCLIIGLTFHYETHWSGPVVGFGVLSTGAQMGATLSMSYALDCHKELSVELMVTIASVKSVVAWIWTWCINDWLIKNGALVVFMSIAAINVAFYLTTLVLFYRGKQIRIWLARRKFASRLGL